MSLPSSSIVAELLRAQFPLDQSMSIEDASIWALVRLGMGENLAFTLATQQFSSKVSRHLKQLAPESLPFTFSQLEEGRIVGKGRALSGDTTEVLRARARLAALPLLRTAVYESGPCGFERISAGLMSLFGAQESFAMCTGDEGGIDIYGRMPLRLPDALVAQSLIPRALVDRRLLFLGQCKCITPDHELDPAVVREFKGAVLDCLRKYEGNRKPPSHRVPADYYKTQETCLKFIFTSGQVSAKASASAAADDITLLDGDAISSLLMAHGVGSDVENNFDALRFARWVDVRATR